jgi:hypothetical protein
VREEETEFLSTIWKNCRLKKFNAEIVVFVAENMSITYTYGHPYV